MNYLIFFILALTAMGCAATVSQNNVAEAPMDLSSGRPVVEVFVNGEGPFPFVIDTGAPRGGMDLRCRIHSRLHSRRQATRMDFFDEYRAGHRR